MVRRLAGTGDDESARLDPTPVSTLDTKALRADRLARNASPFA